MATIFIERISNQNYDEHPFWQYILYIERCEREKGGFVTNFHFHSFIIWHYLYKKLFSRTDRKYSTKVFKTFF